MTQKQTSVVVVFSVIVLIGIIIGVLSRKGSIPVSPGSQPGGEITATSTPKDKGNTGFTSEVPKNAELSVPTQTIQIVNQPNSAPGAKFVSFQITASKSGYSPSSITVKKGDTVEINLGAQDGNFDLFSGSAGFYVSASPSKSGKISFKADTSGTFSFGCKDHCPTGGKISGEFIVLP